MPIQLRTVTDEGKPATLTRMQGTGAFPVRTVVVSLGPGWVSGAPPCSFRALGMPIPREHPRYATLDGRGARWESARGRGRVGAAENVAFGRVGVEIRSGAC